MSHDRVQFIFTGYEKAERPNVEAAIKAFGMTHGDATRAYRQKQTILCRPSQFARFLIYRNLEGVDSESANFFRCLKPELIYPLEKPIDVSCNPADHTT